MVSYDGILARLVIPHKYVDKIMYKFVCANNSRL